MLPSARAPSLSLSEPRCLPAHGGAIGGGSGRVPRMLARQPRAAQQGEQRSAQRARESALQWPRSHTALSPLSSRPTAPGRRENSPQLTPLATQRALQARRAGSTPLRLRDGAPLSPLFSTTPTRKLIAACGASVALSWLSQTTCVGGAAGTGSQRLSWGPALRARPHNSV